MGGSRSPSPGACVIPVLHAAWDEMDSGDDIRLTVAFRVAPVQLCPFCYAGCLLTSLSPISSVYQGDSEIPRLGRPNQYLSRPAHIGLRFHTPLLTMPVRRWPGQGRSCRSCAWPSRLDIQKTLELKGITTLRAPKQRPRVRNQPQDMIKPRERKFHTNS
jgi:hypothetical protein